jgi:hypothetical protein
MGFKIAIIPAVVLFQVVDTLPAVLAELMKSGELPKARMTVPEMFAALGAKEWDQIRERATGRG